MFLDGHDNKDTPPQLPNFSTLQAVNDAFKDPYRQLHTDLLSLLAGPHEGVAEAAGAAQLAATPAGLEHARSSDAVFTETMAALLLALRVFSFGP
jgi:hypothetical protein